MIQAGKGAMLEMESERPAVCPGMRGASVSEPGGPAAPVLSLLEASDLSWIPAGHSPVGDFYVTLS